MNLNSELDVGVGLALPSGLAAIGERYGKPYPYDPRVGEGCPQRAALSERGLGKRLQASFRLRQNLLFFFCFYRDGQ